MSETQKVYEIFYCHPTDEQTVTDTFGEYEADTPADAMYLCFGNGHALFNDIPSFHVKVTCHNTGVSSYFSVQYQTPLIRRLPIR